MRSCTVQIEDFSATCRLISTALNSGLNHGKGGAAAAAVMWAAQHVGMRDRELGMAPKVHVDRCSPAGTLCSRYKERSPRGTCHIIACAACCRANVGYYGLSAWDNVETLPEAFPSHSPSKEKVCVSIVVGRWTTDDGVGNPSMIMCRRLLLGIVQAPSTFRQCGTVGTALDVQIWEGQKYCLKFMSVR